MKNAKNRVKIHTPYIICNDMMYNTWEEIAENVSDFPSGHEELEYGKNDYKAYVKDIKKALKIKKELPDFVE